MALKSTHLGTQAMAEVLSNLTAEKKCTTIVGGGDTVVRTS